MLALFTGSDWCPYCVQLEKKVLKDSSFQKFAEKNVVLLYLDFPRKKQLDAKLTAQNKKLAVKYGVRGYPTSLLLNARGETIGKVTARNARGYIRDIEQLAKKAEKTDKAKK
ncbi:MAG: thioredoxin family protein [Lentisphaeria bacterium]|nr:MAG: thioredoxin family protein [Lentisphaeria bacterium]